MRIPRVFFEGLLAVGSQAELSKEQAHYLGRVLRLKRGRQLILFNGAGGEYHGRISELDGKQGLIDIENHLDVNTESRLDISLAIGLSKGDRFDWVIQKATELGVSSIQPLYTERTEVRLNVDRLEKKLSHWQGIVRSASEQSGRISVPKICRPKSMPESLESANAEVKLILDPEADTAISELAFEKGPSSLSFLVGPEGGFSSTEVQSASKAGYLGVRMGPRILRTETAPIAAIAVIQSKFGDW